MDISHHQGIIDWQKLDKKYTQFVFMKATEGVTHVDTLFERNYREAKKQNIPVGAYHFFTFCKPGKEQAENFIKTVPKDRSDMPPAIDLEYSGNCKRDNHLENLIDEISEYIQIVEDYYEKKVVIYATEDFYNDYLVTNLLDNPIWIRDIYREPRLVNDRPWMFWQYANRGRLKGIETFVDINVFVGTKKDFRELIDN
nr:GH25 family lysozyme [Dysgonomonas sp. 520]